VIGILLSLYCTVSYVFSYIFLKYVHENHSLKLFQIAFNVVIAATNRANCFDRLCLLYLLVNALVAGKFLLVSGSSDCTARLWVKDKCMKILRGKFVAY